MTDGPFLWYLNRSTGFVLLALLTLSVLLGILAAGSTGGRAGQGMPRFVSQSLHRSVALLSVLLLATHAMTAVVDTFVDIRWWQVVLPLGATYQPLWLGLGAVSFDLIAAVVLTSLLRTRLQPRTWRLTHLLSYLAWAIGLAHGIGIGTDMTVADPWGLVTSGICVLLVLIAGGWRLIQVGMAKNTAIGSSA
jgi:sulfoxide reductase heme-binding subunit YedZ